MRIPILSASKNTFIFLTETEVSQLLTVFPDLKNSRSQMAKELCSFCGSGADGLVVVSSSQKEEIDYCWDFYNRDGSSAEMCGNASRCMAEFVREKFHFNKKELVFESLAGAIKVNYLSQTFFAVKMPKTKILSPWRKERFSDGRSVEFCLLNTGVPHAIVEMDLESKDQLKLVIDKLRFHPDLGPSGANVSFYQVLEKNRLKGVTFERGVEDFTASCGTGVTAMAVASSLKLNSTLGVGFEYTIETPGGSLMVQQELGEDFCWLKGQAEKIEDIEILDLSRPIINH